MDHTHTVFLVKIACVSGVPLVLYTYCDEKQGTPGNQKPDVYMAASNFSDADAEAKVFSRRGTLLLERGAPMDVKHIDLSPRGRYACAVLIAPSMEQVDGKIVVYDASALTSDRGGIGHVPQVAVLKLSYQDVHSSFAFASDEVTLYATALQSRLTYDKPASCIAWHFLENTKHTYPRQDGEHYSTLVAASPTDADQVAIAYEKSYCLWRPKGNTAFNLLVPEKDEHGMQIIDGLNNPKGLAFSRGGDFIVASYDGKTLIIASVEMPGSIVHRFVGYATVMASLFHSFDRIAVSPCGTYALLQINGLTGVGLKGYIIDMDDRDGAFDVRRFGGNGMQLEPLTIPAGERPRARCWSPDGSALYSVDKEPGAVSKYSVPLKVFSRGISNAVARAMKRRLKEMSAFCRGKYAGEIPELPLNVVYYLFVTACLLSPEALALPRGSAAEEMFEREARRFCWKAVLFMSRGNGGELPKRCVWCTRYGVDLFTPLDAKNAFCDIGCANASAEAPPPAKRVKGGGGGGGEGDGAGGEKTWDTDAMRRALPYQPRVWNSWRFNKM